MGAPIFIKSDDPAELAREHRRLGYAAAQCPAAKSSDTDRVKAIEKAFAAENVVIAEVGAWMNLLDVDADKRRKNFEYVVERMQLAEAVGARCCVDVAGSFSTESWMGPNPKNLSKEFFDGTVENCRRILDLVKPSRSRFTIEMMPWSLPDGPDAYVRLIKAVDRRMFGVHLDICNVVNTVDKYYDSGPFIDDVFRKLGAWVISCHAKDLKIPPNALSLQFMEVIPGRGVIDYKAYLRNLAQVPFEAPLMLEHLKTDAEYQEGCAYIRRMGAEAGVSFV
jgi:sugar phosphate isomerase/epimerase